MIIIMIDKRNRSLSPSKRIARPYRLKATDYSLEPESAVSIFIGLDQEIRMSMIFWRIIVSFSDWVPSIWRVRRISPPKPFNRQSQPVPWAKCLPGRPVLSRQLAGNAIVGEALSLIATLHNSLHFWRLLLVVFWKFFEHCGKANKKTSIQMIINKRRLTTDLTSKHFVPSFYVNDRPMLEERWKNTGRSNSIQICWFIRFLGPIEFLDASSRKAVNSTHQVQLTKLACWAPFSA